MRLARSICAIFLSVSAVSCASSPMIQPQINSYVVAGRYQSALDILENNRKSYGDNNDLLYFMDYGMVAHSSGRYRDSISAFEQAKTEYDKLFTVSVSRRAATWIVNDNVDEYRGEDFERVHINIFQSINYAKLGRFDSALVEARDADSTLNAIAAQYPADQLNVYKDDAFARFFMGLMYLAAGGRQNINDAYISFAKAYETYDEFYTEYFGVNIPDLLKKELLATADYLGFEEFEDWQSVFGAVEYTPIPQRADTARVYLIQYHGLSPIKHPVNIPVPLPDGYVSRISFPKYTRRPSDDSVFFFQAQKADGHSAPISAEAETVQDIAEIAVRSLEQKKMRVMAKAVLRAGAKHMALRTLEENVRKKSGDTAANTVKITGTLYNVFSEQADLRSWQTLPAEIRMGHLDLKPGNYHFEVRGRALGEMELKAGETYFLTVRTSR